MIGLASVTFVVSRNVAVVDDAAVVVALEPAGTVETVLLVAPAVVVAVELFDELLQAARITTAPRSAPETTDRRFIARLLLRRQPLTLDGRDTRETAPTFGCAGNRPVDRPESLTAHAASDTETPAD
jgi:hypothetical protein